MDSSQVLSHYNIRPSVIRLMIYDYLKGTKTHPTVDDIYRELVKKAPTLSKTSVYNSVKLFTQKGLVKVISIDGTQIRYDADICHHGHFKCEKCDSVFDFSTNSNLDKGLDGFEIKQREVFYSGICKNCLKN